MKPYGLLAEFKTAEQLLAAAQQLHAAGFRHIDAYSPFPIHGMEQAVGSYRDRVPMLTLIGAVLGGGGGYFLQWYTATIAYPLNIGGRPLHSWPSFIPVTFEMTVLGAALFAVFGMLALNRLPKLYHPLFNVPEFELASRSRFFICLRCSDSKYDEARARRALNPCEPKLIVEVPE